MPEDNPVEDVFNTIGDVVQSVGDVASDVVKSDLGKAALIGTAAYFGAPYLASGMSEGAALASESLIGPATGTVLPAGLQASGAIASAAAGAGIPEAASLGWGAAAAGALETVKSVATVLAPVASAAGAVGNARAAKRMAASAGAGPMISPLAPMQPTPIINKRMDAAVEQQLRRRGRMSTILTGEGDKLGA